MILDLDGARITLIDQLSKQWAKFDKMKPETKHPEGILIKNKYFIAIGTKKGNQIGIKHV